MSTIEAKRKVLDPHVIMDFDTLYNAMCEHIAGVHTDKPLPTEIPDDPEPFIEGESLQDGEDVPDEVPK